MKSLSGSIQALERSGIREVMDLAFQRKGVLRLEVGDPDFNTPQHIIEAAAEAAMAGYTHYTPSRGLPEVRQAVAEKLQVFNGVQARVEDVVMTAGGGHGLFSVYKALMDPGDTILAPNPGWPNYRTIGALCGVEVLGYPLMPDREFYPDLERIDQLLGSTPNAKALIVNSPSNPTGSVWPREVLESVLELCAQHDVYLVSDECYEAIVFESKHHSPASFDSTQRTISVFSVSKTYAMTGWRVGYVTGPPEVVELVGKVVENSVSCASAISQKGAEAAIRGDQSLVGQMVTAYRMRRDLALQTLEVADLRAWRPKGAFYVMVAVPTDDTVAFARRLVEAEGVTVAPGQAFGDRGNGMIRISLASDPRTIEEGITRIARFINSSDDKTS